MLCAPNLAGVRPIERAGLELLAFEMLGDGVTAVVTTRTGGASERSYSSLNLGGHVGDDAAAVEANRAAVAAALGVERLVIADQQHEARVAVVEDGAAPSDLTATDALVTATPGVALAILVADCVPVVLWDPVQRVVGVAHAGRGGTLLGIVCETIDVMADRFGTSPSQLRAGIGPHIAGPSYEVGPAEVAEFEEAFPHLDLCVPTADGHACLSLEPAIRHQLTSSGIPVHAIEFAGIDTFSDHRFFSHRAERPCGRFALVALIEPSPPSF